MFKEGEKVLLLPGEFAETEKLEAGKAYKIAERAGNTTMYILDIKNPRYYCYEEDLIKAILNNKLNKKLYPSLVEYGRYLVKPHIAMKFHLQKKQK